MKVVADQAIPWVEHYFAASCEVVTYPAQEITREKLLNADILLVRAVTKVGQALLQGTQVKLVGSVTAGFDHLDIPWLDAAGIQWSTAAGCNATAVAEYVLCTLAYLSQAGLLPSNTLLRVGILGAGHIGQEIQTKLKLLGCETIVYDPPRAKQEADFYSCDLTDLFDLDVITLHVPLINQGEYPTYHFIDRTFLQRQKNNCILINTSRGEVINSQHLKQYGRHLVWCLDVFENEPRIEQEIWQHALLTTPHIAGYSVQSKQRGVEMIYQAAIKKNIIASYPITLPDFPKISYSFNHQSCGWQQVLLAIYNPWLTSQAMKQRLMEDNDQFDQLRREFSLRQEFSWITLQEVILSAADQSLLTGWQLQL